MKESIQIFKSPQFGDIRTAISPAGEPLFCLADICKALDLGNPSQTKQRLQKGGVITNEVIDAKGRVQSALFINEPNLYKCIFQSRKKEAEAFQDWVCSEVLPAIRKTGGYMTARPEETPEQVMARALLIAQDTIDRTRARAEKAESKVILLQSQSKALSRENSELQYQNDYLQSCNDGLQNTVENMRPAAVFAKAVSTSPQSVLMKELAMVISQNKVGVKIGQNRLFQWMRDNGFLCSVKGERYNLPTQKAIDMGLIEVKKSTYTTPDGNTFVTNTPKITGKGQIYFVNRVLYDLINDKMEKGGEA
jgi:prophage antirepressor-like protein